MTNLLVLMPVALGLGLLGLAAFLWSLRTGQYDDLEGAAARVLEDDNGPGIHTPLHVTRPDGGCEA
jgi:cbb3-type cytochrome oxidase maturation protein